MSDDPNDDEAMVQRLTVARMAVTRGDLASAEIVQEDDDTCPLCDGDGCVDVKTFTNFDKIAVGVQFFGVGGDCGKLEAFFTDVMSNIDHLLLLARHGAAALKKARGEP